MNKLLGLAAAALIAQQIGAPAASAAPSEEQLRTISSLARANATEEMRAYVASNPELLAADSPIAGELLFLQSPAAAPRVLDALNQRISNRGLENARERARSRGPNGSIY